MNKIIVKQMKPHRQRVLTDDGQELKLQQWANKKAASSLRSAGGDASGEQFTQARDALMREAVMNPAEYGLKFLNQRIPFEGQQLTEELSNPDPESEAAAIDSQFAPEEEEKPPRVSYPNQTTQDNSSYFSGSGTKDDPYTTDNRDEIDRTQQTSVFDPRFTKKMFKAQKQIFSDAWSVLKKE